MKNTKKIVSLLLVALLTLGLVVGAKGVYFNLIEHKGVETQNQLQYTYSFFTVKGLANDEISNCVNGFLKEDKDKTFFDFIKSNNPNYNGSTAANLLYKSENTLNTPRVLSFKATTALNSGEKELYKKVTGFTFDPANGKLYSLSELFIESADYKGTLNMYVEKSEDEEFREKAKKSVSATQNYYFQDDFLILLFDSETKTYEVPVKMGELSNILKENFQ